MDTTQEGTTEQRRLALLVAKTADYAIFMLDPAGTVLTWNAGAERVHGYRADEIVGRHVATLFTDEDRARDHPSEALRVAADAGRYEQEGWRLRKDGSRFWASVVITAIREEDGELIGFGEVSRDLTARRLAEEHARTRALAMETANRELAEFRRLVSSVRDYAIFMLDPRGNVHSWNAGARHLKGYEPEEIIGRHFSTFYTAEDRARDHPAHELEIAIREGRYEEEGWRVRKDGTTFWASVTITAVHDEAGRLTGYAKVTRDLTERKRGEDALRRAVTDLRRANQELDRFASVAAHDMTDPLRTISGFAELLVETEPAPEEAHEFARHILDSSLRLTGMLQGLLAYARAGRDAEDIAPVPVAAAVAQVRQDLTRALADRRVTVTVDVPSDARVRASPHDLRIILQNLLSNAAKFGAEDGPAIAVGAQRAGGDLWRVDIDDNGPGIGEEDRERIFDAFARASSATGHAGYGLGLAICQRLVTRYGGRIGVEPAPAGGSRFWFTLPSADAPPASDAPADGASAQAG